MQLTKKQANIADDFLRFLCTKERIGQTEIYSLFDNKEEANMICNYVESRDLITTTVVCDAELRLVGIAKKENTSLFLKNGGFTGENKSKIIDKWWTNKIPIFLAVISLTLGGLSHWQKLQSDKRVLVLESIITEQNSELLTFEKEIQVLKDSIARMYDKSKETQLE